MRALLQRVLSAQVDVDGETVGKIDRGLLLFVGYGTGDTEAQIAPLRDKLLGLRVFPNEAGKFDKSVQDISGGILLVSQFTLYGTCDKGRRPDFNKALHPDEAKIFFERTIDSFKSAHPIVESGIFAADMKVSLVNDGPVTLMLEM